jgi:hypothetical protein
MGIHDNGSAPAPSPSSNRPTGRGSDPKLKNDIRKIGTYEGLNVYEWTWNNIAMTTYGL